MSGSNTFGGVIKLQGESEYRRAVSQINSDLKVLSSELGKVTAEFGKNDKSVEGLTSRNKVLSSQIETQKSKITTLKGALQESSEKYGENDKRTQAWQVSLNKAEAELIKMEKELGKNNSSLENYKKYNEQATATVDKLDGEIKTLNGDLEKADAACKKSGNSTESLKNKQEILTEILGKQGEKVRVLKEAMDTASKAYGESSDETKKWEKALNSAEKELQGTEKELKNVDNQMQNASKSTKTFGEMLKANLTADAIKAGIQKLGDAFKSFTNYIGSAVQSASDYGKEMSLMSEKTGISTENLQKFNAASRTTGVDIETFTSTLSRSIRSMNSASDANKGVGAAYSALGVKVRDTSGQLRNAEEVYWDTIDALKNMENETQRDAYAMQIFGKSAMELNPIIKRGSEGFKEITENMITFDDVTMESLRGLNVSMAKFGATMDGVKRSIGVAFAPMMKELADSAAVVGGKFRNLFTAIAANEDQESINKRFAELKDSIVKFAEKLREQIPQFLEIGGKLLGAVWEGIQTAFGPFIPQLIGIGVILAAIVAGWAALMASAVITWPVILVAALAGLIAIFWPQISKFLSDLWSNITDFFSKHWKDMLLWLLCWPAALVKTLNDMGVWEKVGNWLKGIWQNILDFLGKHWLDLLLWIFAWPVALVKTLKDMGLLEKIGNWLGEIWSSICDFFAKLPEEIGYWLGFALGSLVKWGVDAFNWIVTEVPKIIESIVKFFSELPSKIWTWLLSVIENIKNWGSQTGTQAKETGKNFIDNVINFIKELPAKIWTWLSETITKVKTWATDMAKKAKDGAVDTFNNIINTIKNLPNEVFNIGKNIVEGLWNGIKNMGDWIKRQISNFCSGIMQGFKSALGIASPSKLFRDIIGKNLALGLGQGFTDEMASVSKQMLNAVPTDFDVDYNLGAVATPQIAYAAAAQKSPTGINNADYLISAFQQALKGMGFYADDDKIGELIVRKVERVVYA